MVGASSGTDTYSALGGKTGLGGNPAQDPGSLGEDGTDGILRFDTAFPQCTPPSLVSIDIKPGTYPNSINAGKNGRIAVGILSTSTFDAVYAVDQSSLTFGGTGNEDSFIQCATADVNKDKRLDLVCHFDAKNTGFQTGDTEGLLKGTTVQGLPIVGMDSVNIVR